MSDSEHLEEIKCYVEKLFMQRVAEHETAELYDDMKVAEIRMNETGKILNEINRRTKWNYTSLNS